MRRWYVALWIFVVVQATTWAPLPDAACDDPNNPACAVIYQP